MKTLRVKLKADVESVKEFVNENSKFNFDIDVKQGRYTIDAKSLLGVMGINLLSWVELTIISDDTPMIGDYINHVRRFIVDEEIIRNNEN